MKVMQDVIERLVLEENFFLFIFIVEWLKHEKIWFQESFLRDWTKRIAWTICNF